MWQANHAPVSLLLPLIPMEGQQGNQISKDMRAKAERMMANEKCQKILEDKDWLHK